MMRPLTKQEHAVLSLIPDSTATGARHTQALKWTIQDKLAMTPQTLGVYWDNFTEAGLIEKYSGFTRRTKAGDEALVDEPKRGCTITSDAAGMTIMCGRRG